MNPQAVSQVQPEDWREWLADFFPHAVRADFADRHKELWDWAWHVRDGARPFVACWPRGGGKSTTTELVATAWGAFELRKYVLYICETQEQADDHVQNIAALLESKAFGEVYPACASRAVGKFGNPKGWRRNRLRTASGFVVDALGLDTAARGMNLEGQRPDAMIVDDIDGENDSELVTTKKHRTLTRKILPAAAPGCVYMFVENKVHDDSLMAQCLDGRADFFGNRIMSGPFVAIEGLETIGSGAEAIIVEGEPTWKGQDKDTCQTFIRDWGLDAFLSECQHQSVAQAGRFLASIGLWEACEDKSIPELDANTSVIMAMDAGETSDTFAMALISRYGTKFAVRKSRIYIPEGGKALNFEVIEEDIRAWVKQYAVVELTYDRFLLGQMMRRFQAKQLTCPLVPFNQGGDRLEADRALKDAILSRVLLHDGTHTTLTEHLDNANAKSTADGRQLRIVKRSQQKKIDGAVVLSMGLARAGVSLLRPTGADLIGYMS